METLLVNNFDLNTVCRLCLSRDVAMLNIFDCSTKFVEQVADVIMKCAPVQITSCDEMPNLICQSCYTQLQKCHQFQKQIVESDITLRRYLQHVRTTNKQIKVECSFQRSSEDSLIHNTDADTKVKCESSKFQDVSDIIVNLKEEGPSNYTSVYQRIEEIYLKSEIKENLIDDHSSILTECTDNLIDTLSERDADTDKKLNNTEIEERSENVTRLPPADLTEQFATCDDRTRNTVIKLYQCSTCNKCFNKSDTLRKHRRVHTDGKLYQCDVCNKCYRESSVLKKHQRLHTGEKPYQCDVCHKCFSFSHDLIQHQRVHTGEKPYQCDICNKSFTQSSSLKSHKRVHTGEKPYQCDVCSKCFKESSSLKTHQRVHTSEKPYQCDVCKNSFSQLVHLTTHQRVHTGEKPYQCDVCSKCFRESCHLRSHQRVHTGEKPYQCDICNKSFTQSGGLKYHQRVHTGEKTYQCDD